MKNPAAVALGRLGGKATSEAKANAARENAKKGGWPKGKPRKRKGDSWKSPRMSKTKMNTSKACGNEKDSQ